MTPGRFTGTIAVLSLKFPPAPKHASRAQVICPGATETPNYMRSTGGDAHLLDDMIPMRRIGQPEDVAETVLWLLSEKASYVTGSTFSVDGGMSI
jgi:NAD(P)-dependent dehydrogenase (short-subunit alcohol dehydrogenase family)